MTEATILGYLARFCSFTTQSEVLCTQGLTYLLREYEDARSALARKVEVRTGVDIGDSLTWRPEVEHADGRIPDLEACTAGNVPVVMIEAKLGAELGKGSLESYLADMRERNDGQGAMLVLVPNSRITEIAGATASALGLDGAGPWPATDGNRIGIAVISWEELFIALNVGKEERFRLELEQLQAMYTELRGNFIAPLASDEDLRQWESCETNFVELVNQVTRRLTKLHRIYPTVKEPLDQDSPEREPRVYELRYVCPCNDDAKSCYSIGVRVSFEGWITPIWMRFHRATSNFKVIRQRIELSNLEQVESGGHIWIPLEVLRDASGEKMIENLVKQAEKVLQVAYQAE